MNWTASFALCLAAAGFFVWQVALGGLHNNDLVPLGLTAFALAHAAQKGHGHD